MYIVGIDIAKRKHEAAVIDGEGTVIIKPFSFTNNCSGYNRLLAMLTKAKLPLDEVSFAMEATGHYWLALFTRLQKEGFRVQVINPVQTNSIRSFYIRQAKTDPRDALLIAEVIRFGHFSESTLHPENIYELRELCRGRHAIVSMQADVKRKVVALLDQVFPEYETAFTNLFGDTSMAILQTCPTPKELSEMPFEELCHLIEVSSHKRFRMAKAQELQALAHGSFGFAMAGDVFSTMIRLYAKHLDFLKQQVREMDRKIAEIMDTLDTPITTITDPWRVHPQRDRRHQPFFLRGKACRLRGDRSNHAAVWRIQRRQKPYVQTRLALFAARHLAGGFIGGAPRSGAEALFSEKTG